MESNNSPYSALSQRRFSWISSRVLAMSFNVYEFRRINVPAQEYSRIASQLPISRQIGQVKF
jgi:hypothetical protein